MKQSRSHALRGNALNGRSASLAKMADDKSSMLTETIAPADQAAVAEAVRDAGDKGVAVYPIGGGTSVLGFGAKPWRTARRCLLQSSRAKLNRLIDYAAADMTVTVEAGMTISQLQRQLAEKRQWLPVDVGYPDRATIGGAIARNAAGPRRYAYGTMRDYLLGFTAVDGTGMVFSGGGRVVKNAAGYNMCRLMAGSLGALGIITQATLMVRPLPEAAALLACEVPDFDLAEKLLAGLVKSLVRPVAVELSAGGPYEGNPLFGPVSEGNVGSIVRRLRGFGRRSGMDARSTPPGVDRARDDFAGANAQPRHRSALALDGRIPRRLTDRRAAEQDG